MRSLRRGRGIGISLPLRRKPPFHCFRTGGAVEAVYDAYEMLPGPHVNGRISLGENISDLGGLPIAYQAYKSSRNGKQAPVINGFTGEQRFFLGCVV